MGIISKSSVPLCIAQLALCSVIGELPLKLSALKYILIYKTVLKPTWTYGIELWGCASTSNIAVIQRYQSKLLRTITNAPWYVSIHTLHQDLRVPTVRKVFQERTATHRSALDSHPNPLVVYHFYTRQTTGD